MRHCSNFAATEIWLCAALVLVTLGPLTACAETPRAVPVDGKPFAAELVSLDEDWQLTFAAGKDQRPLPAVDLIAWGSCAELAGGPIVVLADGGLLAADVQAIDKETLAAESALLGSVKLPLDLLAGTVFHPPAARAQRERLLDRVARASGDTDRLILVNGDEITGTLERLENDAVQLKSAVGPAKIETDRIAALVFNPALGRKTAAKDLRAWVGLRDGSRLLATSLVVDAASARMTIAEGPAWTALPKEVVWLQPLGGRAVYVSQLPVAEYRYVPYFSLSWPYQLDRNVTGGWLRCGGRLYPLGLGMHSAARLSYLLSERYQRFEAELGIDDSTDGGGSVRLRVFVDGQEKYVSQTIRGGSPPVPVSIELDDAKRLDLVVDYAERGDVLDHADWLNARLIRENGGRRTENGGQRTEDRGTSGMGFLGMVGVGLTLRAGPCCREYHPSEDP